MNHGLLYFLFACIRLALRLRWVLLVLLNHLVHITANKRAIRIERACRINASLLAVESVVWAAIDDSADHGLL